MSSQLGTQFRSNNAGDGPCLRPRVVPAGGSYASIDAEAIAADDMDVSENGTNANSREGDEDGDSRSDGDVGGVEAEME